MREQSLGRLHAFAFLKRLECFDSFFVLGIDSLFQKIGLIEPHNRLILKILEYRLTFFREIMVLKIRQQNDTLQLLNRELVYRIERTNGLHLVEVENYAVRIVVGERKHVDDAASDGKLAWLNDEIDMFKIIFQQGVGNEIHIDLLSYCKL